MAPRVQIQLNYEQAMFNHTARMNVDIGYDMNYCNHFAPAATLKYFWILSSSVRLTGSEEIHLDTELTNTTGVLPNKSAMIEHCSYSLQLCSTVHHNSTNHVKSGFDIIIHGGQIGLKLFSVSVLTGRFHHCLQAQLWMEKRNKTFKCQQEYLKKYILIWYEGPVKWNCHPWFLSVCICGYKLSCCLNVQTS